MSNSVVTGGSDSVVTGGPDSVVTGGRPSEVLHSDAPRDLTATVDVVVVGAGLAGAAAAAALTARGRSVCVLEAAAPAGRHGSSHGSARIFRRAYPDPFWAALTGRALTGWRDLEARSGRTLLRLTGGVDHGAARHPELVAQALTACAVPHELLDPAAATERWPGLRFAGPVLFHPDAGPLDPERAVAAMLDLARADGAVVATSTPAVWIETTSDAGPGSRSGVRVHTPAGTVTAAVAVLAVGAWLPPVLDALGDPVLTARVPRLDVRQHQVFHLPRRVPPPAGTVDDWPILVHQLAPGEGGTGPDDADSLYGLPGGRDAGDAGGIKVAEHDRGIATTAATRDGVVDERSRRRVRDYVERWLPGLLPEPYAEASCLYTNTADEDFLLDRAGPLVLASPCSGHGAKFAPVVGELIADLATGAAPIPRFALRAAA